jgi:hypothetical protein
MPTHSEEVFEKFLRANNIPFEKIEEVNQKGARRPDYLVDIGSSKLIFEVKQLGGDDEEPVLVGSWISVPGDQIRYWINHSKKQVQFGANQGIPSMLLIYNNLDPVFQLRGTDEFDFRTAMYGELTKLIDRTTRESSEFFHGRKNELAESKNTSFSAVGHLCDRGGNATSVTLWENAFAKIKLPFDQLPPCFQVHRVEINADPLTFS